MKIQIRISPGIMNYYTFATLKRPRIDIQKMDSNIAFIVAKSTINLPYKFQFKLFNLIHKLS